MSTLFICIHYCSFDFENELFKQDKQQSKVNLYSNIVHHINEPQLKVKKEEEVSMLHSFQNNII